jgi:hypothetical protein
MENVVVHKLIDAAKEALEVAKCDHDLRPITNATSAALNRFSRFICPKCQAVFYVPTDELLLTDNSNGERGSAT